MKTTEEFIFENLGTDIDYFIDVKDLKNLLEEYANQSKWIDVKDKLPPEWVMKISKDVIVSDGKNVFVDCYDYEFNFWCKLRYESDITHWMELPNPPTAP